MNKQYDGERRAGYIDPKDDISEMLFTKDEKKQKLIEIDYLLNKNFDEASTTKEQGQIEQPTGKPRKKKKSKKILIGGLIAVTLLIGMFFGYKVYLMGGFGRNVVKTEWGDIILDVPQAEEMVNVLVIGFDEGGYRTDTMMIVNFDPKTSNVNLISIPRDTLIGINGKRMKLNAAFAVGKFDLTIKSIRQLIGMPIHYYVATDTKGFRSIIDALGGVDFDVQKDLKYSDPTQNLYIDLKNGMQHLDGNKAEQLVRYRKYVMGDLDREEVQKKFMKALIEQKLTLANLSDKSKVKAVYDSLSAHVKTNAGLNDGLRYFVAAVKIKPENFKTYILPGVPQNINGVSYYVYNKKDSINLFKQIYGQNEEPRFGIAQGIELYDVANIGQSSKSSQTGKSTTSGETTGQTGTEERDIFRVEKIEINDGKDASYTDVGAVKPISPSDVNEDDFQLDDDYQTTDESSTSTEESGQSTDNGSTKEASSGN